MAPVEMSEPALVSCYLRFVVSDAKAASCARIRMVASDDVFCTLYERDGQWTERDCLPARLWQSLLAAAHSFSHDSSRSSGTQIAISEDDHEINVKFLS